MANRKLRLLMVTPNFPPDIGGTQTYSHMLAAQFHQMCDGLVVVAPHRRKAVLSDRVEPFDIRRIRGLTDNLAFSGIIPLRRLISTAQFDAVFCTHWSAAFAALKARGDDGLPVFCAAHGKELLIQPLARLGPLQRVYDWVRKTALRDVETFFPVSRHTASILNSLGVHQSRLCVVNNGVDSARFVPAAEPGKPSHPKHLLTVARLVPRKGIDSVIECLPEVRKAVPDIKYVVVGDGPDRQRLQTIAQRKRVTDCVEFLGGCSAQELVRHYQSCDLFVMPASSEGADMEGFGIAFLEAGACGKPVIGAHEGGVPDAIINGETGILINRADETALSGAIIRLLTDDDLARRLGENGRVHAEEKSWQESAHQILNRISG